MDFDRSTLAFNGAVSHCQPHAGTATDWSGSKKWIEDVGYFFWLDACARVGYVAMDGLTFHVDIQRDCSFFCNRLTSIRQYGQKHL